VFGLPRCARFDVAAQVAGQVVNVYVRDQQNVSSGDPLFDIDPRSYEAAVAKAQAQLALARQNVQQQSAAVDTARAQLAQRQAEELNARPNNERTEQLAASGFFSKQAGEQARTQALSAQAAVHAAEATLAQAQSALGEAGDANASTGNWVKVTQRVPVRVRVVNTDPVRPLRIGTTALLLRRRKSALPPAPAME